MHTTHALLRRPFGSRGTSGASLPNRPPRHRLGLLFLLVLLIGGSTPFLQVSAGDPAGPGNNGTARETGREVAGTVARAIALYGEFRSREALTLLQRALAVAPKHPEVLIWTARTYVDVGDLIPESVPHWQAKRVEQYRAAERYAHAAARVRPESTWPHFFLAVALGKLAEFSGTKEQIALAKEIRKAVDKAIALDPDNGFAYHVLGVWHRRLAEINAVERLLARVFLQRSVPAGRMEESARLLEKALRYNPDIIIHHLELAKTYRALGKTDLAMKHLVTVDRLPARFSDDGVHKRNARKLLQAIERNGSGCHEHC